MAGVGGEGISEPCKELLLHGLGCRMGQAFQASRCRQFDLQLLVAFCEPVDQDRNRRLIHTAVRTAPGFDRLCVRRIPLPEPRPLPNLLLVVAGQAFVKIVVALGIWRDPETLGKMPDHLTGHVVPTRGETAFALEVFEEDGTPEPARAALGARELAFTGICMSCSSSGKGRAALGAKELAFTGRNGERLQEFLRRDMLMHGDLIEDKGACHKRGFAAHRTLVLDTAGPDAQACAIRRATIKVPVRALP